MNSPEWNPRVMSKNARERLNKSLQEFGILDDIIWNKRTNNIVGGNQRARELKRLGVEEVTVTVIDVPIEKEKAINVALNNPNLMGEYDQDKLNSIFCELAETPLIESTGFTMDEIAQFRPTGEATEDAFDTEEAVKKPKYKINRGEIYKLGDHRMMCGDSTNPNEFERLMDGRTAKICFTSPPYNMGGGMYQNYKDDLKSEDYIRFNLDVVKIIECHLKGFIFWNLSYNKNARWEFMEIFNRIRTETNLEFLELVVWNKKTAMPITSREMLTRQYEDIMVVGTDDEIKEEIEWFYLGRNEKAAFNKKTNKGLSNYWEIPVGNVQSEIIQACFPVRLPARGINLMTGLKDLVVDPFGGSGTTLIAAEQLQRICYTMELDPVLCSAIIERWETLTGQKAKKL
jgi:DNA modification methylase